MKNNMNTKKEICKGSCGETVPINHNGPLTESCRTVIHHPHRTCHYISQLHCRECNPHTDTEIVICAAIRWNNKVWRGHRHGDAMQAMRQELSFTMTGKEMIGKNLFEDQGFVTSFNRYVDREEGRKIQEAAGIKSVAEEGYRYSTLFSEDLY